MKPYKTVSLNNNQIYINDTLLKTPKGNSLTSLSSSILLRICSEFTNNANKEIKDFSSMPITRLAFTYLDKYNFTEYFNYFSKHIEYDCLLFLENKTNNSDIIIKYFQQDFGLDLNKNRVEELASIFLKIDISKIKQLMNNMGDIESFCLFDLAEVCDSLLIAIYGVLHNKDHKWFFNESFADELYNASKWGYDDLAEKRRDSIKQSILNTLEFMSMIKP